MIRVQHYTGDKFYRRKDLDVFAALSNGINGSMIDTLRDKDPRDHIFVMRENSKIIGWCSASRLWSGDYGRDDSFYLSFFIERKCRGRGLAKRFAAKLRQHIPEGNTVLGWHYVSVRRLMDRQYVEVIFRDNSTYSGWDRYRLLKKGAKHETKA
jgi:GNAT superfamily N-acetyltransferase